MKQIKFSNGSINARDFYDSVSIDTPVEFYTGIINTINSDGISGNTTTGIAFKYIGDGTISAGNTLVLTKLQDESWLAVGNLDANLIAPPPPPPSDLIIYSTYDTRLTTSIDIGGPYTINGGSLLPIGTYVLFRDASYNYFAYNINTNTITDLFFAGIFSGNVPITIYNNKLYVYDIQNRKFNIYETLNFSSPSYSIMLTSILDSLNISYDSSSKSNYNIGLEDTYYLSLANNKIVFSINAWASSSLSTTCVVALTNDVPSIISNVYNEYISPYNFYYSYMTLSPSSNKIANHLNLGSGSVTGYNNSILQTSGIETFTGYESLGLPNGMPLFPLSDSEFAMGDGRFFELNVDNSITPIVKFKQSYGSAFGSLYKLNSLYYTYDSDNFPKQLILPTSNPDTTPVTIGTNLYISKGLTSVNKNWFHRLKFNSSGKKLDIAINGTNLCIIWL